MSCGSSLPGPSDGIRVLLRGCIFFLFLVPAAVIGKGTYFAVDASYSAHDTYSTPDASGRKYVYLARVLTGEFTVGQNSYVTPPPKTPGGVDLYDSVTNDLANPSVFVIFYDAQAYPEYLITFRK